MAISKGFRYKDKEGKVTDYEYGVNGSNVTQDSEHHLVTDEEKQTWNDKADLEDIPSGSAASHAVANNCTTTAAGSVLDARQGKVLMDKANQLSSDLASLNDEGAIKGLEVREGDGVYITYQDGADTVSKKLGSPADSILLAGGRFSGTGENAGNNARILLSDVFERVEVDYSTNSGDLYLYYYNSGSYVKNEKVTSGSKLVFYPNETYDEIRITMFQNSTLMFTYTITGYFQ